MIELLVVIVILGLLAAIAVVGLRGNLAVADKKACEADYQAVATAIGAYLSDYETINAATFDLNSLVNPASGDPYLSTYPESSDSSKTPSYFRGAAGVVGDARIVGNGGRYWVKVAQDLSGTGRWRPQLTIWDDSLTATVAAPSFDISACDLIQ